MIMSIDPLLYEEYFSSYFNSIVEAPNYIDPEFVIIDTGSKTGLYDLNGNTAVTRLCREDTYSEIYNEMGHFFIIGLSFVRSNSSNYDRNTPAIYTETTLNISSCVFGSRSDNQNFGISVKGSAMGHDYYAPFFRVSYCSFIESSNEDNYVLDFQCLPTHRVSPIINNNYSVDNNFFLLADVSLFYLVSDNLIIRNENCNEYSQAINIYQISALSTNNFGHDMKLAGMPGTIDGNSIYNYTQAIDIISDGGFFDDLNSYFGSKITNNILRECYQGVNSAYREIGGNISRNIIEINPERRADNFTEESYAFKINLVDSNLGIEKSDYFNNTVINISTDQSVKIIVNNSQANKLINNIIYGFSFANQEDNNDQFISNAINQDFGLNTIRFDILSDIIDYQEAFSSETAFTDDFEFNLFWQSENQRKSPCINRGYDDTHEYDENGRKLQWDEQIVYFPGVQPIYANTGYYDILLCNYVDEQSFTRIPSTRDKDLTRKDIGAIPYIPKRDSLEFTNQDYILGGGRHMLIDPDFYDPNRPYRWLSFPAIDQLIPNRVDVSYCFEEQANQNLFIPSQDQQLIENIEYNYDNENQFILNNGTEWSFLGYQITSPQGFKLKLHADADLSSPLYIDYDGFVPGIAENPQSEIELNQFDENSQKSTTLIGYYLKDTKRLFDVIPSEILDKLTVIKCQDWAAVNIGHLNQTAKSTWLTSMGQTVVNSTISYGDAIELVHEENEDINFHWNTSGTPVRPEYIDLPSHFDYEQEAGYMPIICELDLDEYDDGDKPIEVAIFVDEICKGAEVIKSDQVILKAYIVDDPSLIGKEVVFQLYFSHTKAKKELDNYLVMDFAKKVFISRPLTINPQKSYEFVTFKDIEYNNNIPQVDCLLGNYPNPFNPETTINFFITEKTTGSLKIFNLRGQLVNTVINKEAFSKGYHKVTWNGKDSSQHRVTSGIYFYKLETEHTYDVGKMILLK